MSIKKFLHYFLVLVFLSTQIHVVHGADPFILTAKSGEEYGRELVESQGPNMPQVSIDSEIMFSDGTSLSVSNLYSVNDLGHFLDIETLKDGYNSHGELNDIGNSAKDSLYSDTSNSIMGEAYDTVLRSKDIYRPDLSNDPVFLQTKNTFSNIESISAAFGDCSATTQTTNAHVSKHVPEIKVCQRVLAPDASCEVEHDYDVQVLTASNAQYNRNFTITITTGQRGNNYWTGGNCSVHSTSNIINVINPTAIKKVTLNTVHWDDYAKVYFNNEAIWGDPLPVVDIPQGSPGYNFPNRCERERTNTSDPRIDVTAQFMSQVHSRGGIVDFGMKVVVGGGGEGFAEITVEYDPYLAVVSDTWAPPECVAVANGHSAGYASATKECTAITSDAALHGCDYVNGVYICNQHFPTPLLHGVDALCKKVQVDVTYHFENVLDGIPENTCGPLEENPQCSFVGQRCTTDDPLNPHRPGQCAFFEETWDCGYDIAVEDIVTDTNYDCGGPIRCMGVECIDPEKTESTSFHETLAIMNAAGFMSQDMNCSPSGTDCKVFSGKPLTCKIAIGGAQDCCDVPTGASSTDYIMALYQIYKLNSSLMAIQNGNAAVGAYQTIAAPINQTLSTVTKPFTSYIENISGTVTDFFEPVEIFMDELKEKIKQTIQDALADMLKNTGTDMAGEAAAGAVSESAADAAAEEAASALMENMAGAASALMMAYTVYVVAMLVIQAIYQCEDMEFELAAKQTTKSCTYLGSYCVDSWCLEKRRSYCCYNSPLARIIDEQYHGMKGINYGDIKNPNCGGIPIGEIGSVDWSQMNLSEWVALLGETQLLPTVATLNADGITGSGSNLNIDGTRLDAVERNHIRMEGLDISGAKREAKDNIIIDPSGKVQTYE